jgi:hypothetical protein
VLGYRDKQRVDEEPLIGCGHFAHQQEKEVIGEVDFSDKLVAQIAPANCNRCGVRSGNGGVGRVLFADAHSSILLFGIGTDLPDIEIDFDIRKNLV